MDIYLFNANIVITEVQFIIYRYPVNIELTQYVHKKKIKACNHKHVIEERIYRINSESQNV